jgi:Fic family protein
MTSPVSLTWFPRYTLNPAIARGLMAIEAARAVVAHTPLPPAVEAVLRQRARVRSVHYSTQIEGNRLTLAEAEQVIAGRKVQFHGRERDRSEVQHYWNALLRAEEWAANETPLTEALIGRLHALVEKGARARPTPYRDGQNAIRDTASGALVYLPPEAQDVPALMAAMVRWVEAAEKEGLPVPLTAGLVHYQFVTIHPFYDGNGRTARLLATFLLHRGGYGLNGFFSLEEHHAQDLPGYYPALATHPQHNYYMGRETADLTPWLEYFIEAVAAVFAEAQQEAVRLAREGGGCGTRRAAPAGSPGAQGTGAILQVRADRLGRRCPGAGALRAHGQGSAQGVGDSGMDRGGQCLEAGQGIRVIGSLSAIHGQLIGND